VRSHIAQIGCVYSMLDCSAARVKGASMCFVQAVGAAEGWGSVDTHRLHRTMNAHMLGETTGKWNYTHHTQMGWHLLSLYWK